MVAPPVDVTKKAEPPAADSASKHRDILVVDDMPEICDYFASLAKRVRGFDVTLVTEVNSARALQLVREKTFDLVISDYRMREVDGVEVLQAARQHNPTGYRILMTGYNEVPTSIDRIRSAAVDAYVQKPLRAQDLLLLLLDFIQSNEQAITTSRAQARELELLGAREERRAKASGALHTW